MVRCCDDPQLRSTSQKKQYSRGHITQHLTKKTIFTRSYYAAPHKQNNIHAVILRSTSQTKQYSRGHITQHLTNKTIFTHIYIVYITIYTIVIIDNCY